MQLDTWRKLSIWVAIPCLIISGVNAWRLWNEHWEHQAHLPPVEERTEYPFMNIRNKAFPWGDGDKVRIYIVSRGGVWPVANVCCARRLRSGPMASTITRRNDRLVDVVFAGLFDLVASCIEALKMIRWLP